MSSVTVIVEKNNIGYICQHKKGTGTVKCGRCLRGVISYVDQKRRVLKSPVGRKCKVCGAKVTEWVMRTRPEIHIESGQWD